jgi:glutathione synthase/RimK-type ligase-like ATP-grasp enzyme
MTIGVLVPTNGAHPEAPPHARPIGRAALQLAREGIDVVFGDTVTDGCIHGVRAVENGWESVDGISIVGAHDRFPSQLRADRFGRILDGLCGVELWNSLEFTMLCRDKLVSQQRLESLGIRMPAVVEDPSLFSDRLAEWKHAFLKPRYGALGIGVTAVQPGEPLPAMRTGVVPSRPDPTILQKGIAPPSGWASRTVRVLLQRTPDGGWFQHTPVLRQSRVDPVANAARGAEVVAGPEALDEDCLGRIFDSVAAIAAAFEGMPEAARMVEAGVDLVLDERMDPWLIEVNSRPRGRLEMLASQRPDAYRPEHIEACARPLRVIAAMAKRD